MQIILKSNKFCTALLLYNLIWYTAVTIESRNYCQPSCFPKSQSGKTTWATCMHFEFRKLFSSVHCTPAAPQIP